MHSDPNARCQPRQVHAPRSRPRARMRMALRDARPGDAARAGRVPPDTAWTAGSPRAGPAWVRRRDADVACAVAGANRKTGHDIIAGNLLVLRTGGAMGPTRMNVSPREPRGR